VIEVRQLAKHFNDRKRGEVRAVDSVSFRCEPGRIFGLLGVNGAGKTTCLRMVATILKPTSGTASFHSASPPARPVCSEATLPQPRRILSGGIVRPLRLQ